MIFYSKVKCVHKKIKFYIKTIIINKNCLSPCNALVLTRLEEFSNVPKTGFKTIALEVKNPKINKWQIIIKIKRLKMTKKLSIENYLIENYQ